MERGRECLWEGGRERGERVCGREEGIDISK